MSVSILQGGSDYRHTFQDDMESFFYVVLYAALRWLPHNYNEELGNLMERYFNEYYEFEGNPEGGDKKASNRNGNGRTFTNKINWANKDLARWINQCLYLQEKTRGEQPDWTENNLRESWERLDGKDLLTDDRVEHTIVVDFEETEEGEFQATSASVHCEAPAQLCRQISGPISGDITSLVQPVSTIANSSCHRLGKRPTTGREMAAGSKESSLSRERKRRRPLRAEQVERASRIASDN